MHAQMSVRLSTDTLRLPRLARDVRSTLAPSVPSRYSFLSAIRRLAKGTAYGEALCMHTTDTISDVNLTPTDWAPVYGILRPAFHSFSDVDLNHLGNPIRVDEK